MTKEAQTYAEDTGLLFMETSAKTAMNVNELFLAIGEWPFVFTFQLKISFISGENDNLTKGASTPASEMMCWAQVVCQWAAHVQSFHTDLLVGS